MRKKTLLAWLLATATLTLSACGAAPTPAEESNGLTKVDTLNIAFAPYDSAETILSATKPMGELLKTTLQNYGYDVGEVNMTVSSSYEACAEALSAGTADVGFISGGTYTLYDDGCELLLTALRQAYSKDSTTPSDWNDGVPGDYLDSYGEYYRCIVLAGPSAKGQELAAKVNGGQTLTWEDLDSASWCVLSASSSSGYIYPSLWLQENYGKGITDLSHVIQSDSHGTSVARLAAEQADVIVSYAHIQYKSAEDWTTTLGRTTDIWHETNVIGVTQGIYNDTVCVSKTSETMTEEFKQAVGNALIDLGNTDEGKEIISTFAQVGYAWGDDANYDGAREAQAMLKAAN